MLTHTTSAYTNMTKYFYRFSPRNASFSEPESLCVFGAALALLVIPKHSLSCSGKNCFGHIFFSVCCFKCIFELQFLSNTSDIGYPILLIVTCIVTEISDDIGTLTKHNKVFRFLKHRIRRESGIWQLSFIFLSFLSCC